MVRVMAHVVGSTGQAKRSSEAVLEECGEVVVDIKLNLGSN